MSLYNKYRPTDIEEIIGNTSLKRSLISLMHRPISEFPSVVLLHGPAGCGKTTLGRIIARHLGAYDLEKPESARWDYSELDSAQYTGIDHIRDLRRQSNYMPTSEGGTRVWLLDEVHRLSGNAQDALLKLLENPPKHCYYILCTTEPNKLIKTVRQRCMEFQVQPLDEDEMLHLLKRIRKAERKKIPEDVLEQICGDSLGTPRTAIQIFEKIMDLPPEEMEEAAKQSASEQNEIIELCRVLLQGSSWKKVASILSGLRRQDPESIRRVILGYATSVLLKKENDVAFDMIDKFIDPTYDIGFAGVVWGVYQITKGG